jgi:hypothetical protein
MITAAFGYPMQALYPCSQRRFNCPPFKYLFLSVPDEFFTRTMSCVCFQKLLNYLDVKYFGFECICALNFDIYVCIAEYFPFVMDFALFKKKKWINNSKAFGSTKAKSNKKDSENQLK